MTTPTKASVAANAAIAAAFVVLVGIVSMVGRPDGETPETDKAVSEILQELAEAANELKGAEVETDVVFRGATVENGQRLTYDYTVAGLANRPIDPRIVRMAEDQLKRESCADRIIRKAIDGGGAVRYVYRSASGTNLFSVEIDRQSCFDSQ